MDFLHDQDNSMARQKKNIHRVTAFLNQAQYDAMMTMITENMADTPSQFIRSLITEAWRGRTEEKTRRPVGRPRKDDSPGQVLDNELRNIPHPDQFSDANRGTFMTQSEYDEWMENHPWHKARLKGQS